MRKNKSRGKGLNLYYVYEISGLNLDNLVNTLKSRGVTLFGVRKKSAKLLRVSVNYADDKKFFAITEELCYNIKKVGEKGGLRFFHRLFADVGLLIGAVIFAFSLIAADDFIFKIEFMGSGSVYEREITEFLRAENVVPFSRFSNTDLPALSDMIAAYSDKISFAECVKNGNRLKITLVIAENSEKTVSGDKSALYSGVDGEIEFIKVYRGTALKVAGERVRAGEQVCAGYAVIKDKTVEVGVIASFSVRAEFVYEYYSAFDGEEDFAEIFALERLGEGDILSVNTEKTVFGENEYLYRVKIIFRRLYYG